MNRILLRAVCAGICVMGACNVSRSAEGPKGTEKQIAKIVWLQVEKAGQLPSCAKLDKDEKLGDVVKITRTPEVPQLIEIAKIEDPATTQRAYILRGKVKFDGVGGEGFLEIWNHFPEPKKGRRMQAMDIGAG